MTRDQALGWVLGSGAVLLIIGFYLVALNAPVGPRP